ncbi:hypothetical protein [uncultured Methylibium sp.]|uniref:hypothetical protein n=1 Tax=uncultured Methylibium sp. TaxID=381093 RepID=UPI0025FA3663|nr:hypothetical protein [uncultured Methylibium sp.]
MGMPGPQKINRYGVAFKLKAVQMSKQPGGAEQRSQCATALHDLPACATVIVLTIPAW